MKTSIISCVLIVFSLMVSHAQTRTKLDFLKMAVSTVDSLEQPINLQLCKPVLGIACKIENKQSNKKLFNYRARLGNLNYVNSLEGK